MRNPLVCLDAKLKLIITLALLSFCAFVSSISMCCTLLILLFVGIGLLPNKKEFIRRALLFLPFVLATFTLPLFFTPGKLITHGITYEGLHKGCLLGIRTFLAIGYPLIFVLSTPPIEIAKSLDWITMNRLKLGETLLIALKFIETIKNSRGVKLNVSTLKYVIEETCRYYAKYKTGN